MADAEDPKSTALHVFMWSYHEHDWTVEEEAAAHAEFLRRGQIENWFPVEEIPYKNPELLCHVDSLDALKDLVRQTMVDDWGMPAEGVELPFAKLKTLMAAEGWQFVGGSFQEFEGHHNDTEIQVVLSKLPLEPL